METSNPLVWLPADHRWLGEGADLAPYLVLGDKYARAIRDGAGAQPVMFPLAGPEQIPGLLALVDGVMLTGSPSNVDPAYFGQAVADPELPLDMQRDSLTLPLVRACLANGVPLLGVCRGFQEINVALGGTLHQAVHDVPGLMDHREDESRPLPEQYAPSHEVRLAPGSVFERWAGGPVARVNSLHGQGIDRLADGLRALGHAPDGLVEAYEVSGARAFAYAVQWHPEWRLGDHDFYAAIFRAFGQACAQHRRRRDDACGAGTLVAEAAQD